MGTTGVQLARWCHQNYVVGFKGVFSSNNLPKVYQPDNMCLIVNHSPSYSPSGGSHWLACRIKKDKAYWFDSYGNPPHSTLENDLMGSKTDPDPHFDRWLKSAGVKHLQYNDQDLQSLFSEVCGLYACYFCKHGLPQNNREAWLWLSDTDVTQNDEKIKELVKV